jgi:hypothetical protein
MGGNDAFVPTSAVHYFLQIQRDGQYGDLLAVDLTNFSGPALVGTLEQPRYAQVWRDGRGGKGRGYPGHRAAIWIDAERGDAVDR